MIELATVKTLVEISKQVFDVITGAAKYSQQRFDETLGKLFTELESVSASYFGLFSTLRGGVADSQDAEQLGKAVDAVLAKRREIVLNRNKITGMLEAYRDINRDSKRADEDTTPDHLLNFLRDVDAFFYEPFGQGTSQFTKLLDDMESILSNNSDYETAKHACLQDIDMAIADLETFWKQACKNFELLRHDSDFVQRKLKLN